MTTNPGITVRKAEVSDASAIADVQVAAWQVAYKGMIPDKVLDAFTVAKRTARWDEILSDYPGETLVASVAGELIAWISYGKNHHEVRPESVAEIYGLYVHPDWWRSGAGRLLWHAATERIKRDGFGSLDVWVLEANERARRFYEAVGCTIAADSAQIVEGDGYAASQIMYSSTL